MTKTQRLIQALAKPVCAEVNQAMQNLTSVAYITSEQHKDLSVACQKRDAHDVNKLDIFIQDKDIFGNHHNLQNLVNGVVATENVNAEKAEDVGCKILEGMQGKQVMNYTFRKKDQAVTMDFKSKIAIDTDDVTIDPLLLFQRLVMVSMQKESLEEAFCYVLCGYPL